MKSRTSFFDKTVLKKDITRFLPVWMIYTICGLLVAFSTAMGYGRSHDFAKDLNQMTGTFGIINICYGGIVAVLLFGDLFNTRLCNALHAMPLRREGWFFTHITAGFLFSAVPNLLIALLIMPALGKFWFTAFWWYLGMELHYVFFFLLAVLCSICAGKWFAAISMYAIVNFLSMIVMWFASTVFQPMMYGVKISIDGFSLFSPVVQLVNEEDFFRIEHNEACLCHKQDSYYWEVGGKEHIYDYLGPGESWIYLGILAAIGLAFGVLALVLYRKRHLETAGDFVAFRPLHPVFAVIFTLCAGALLQMIGGEVFGDNFYLFGIIGILVGFFVAQMLLTRTVKVFRGKNWLFLGAIAAVLALSLVLCRADAFGIVRWTPDTDDVVDVKVAEGQFEEWYPSTDYYTVTDPDEVQAVIDIHKLLIAEGPVDERDNYNGSRYFTLCYTLADGREVRRYYRANYEGEAFNRLNAMFFGRPDYILGASTLEQLQQSTEYLFVEGHQLFAETKDALLECVMQDVLSGTLGSNGGGYDKEAAHIGYVELSRYNGIMKHFVVTDRAKNTAAWLKSWMKLAADPGYVRDNATAIAIDGVTLSMNPEDERFASFLDAWEQDHMSGWLFYNAYKDQSLYQMVITLQFGDVKIPVGVYDYAENLSTWLKKAE